MQSALEYSVDGVSSITASVPLIAEPDFGACGRAALAANQLEQATSLMEQAIRRLPGDADLHNCLGIALSGRGQHSDAIESFARAVQLGPNNARYWHNLGAAHRAARHPMKAARYYQIAIRLLPSYQLARTALRSLSAEHPSLRISNGDEIPVRTIDGATLTGIEMGLEPEAPVAPSDACIVAETNVKGDIMAEPPLSAPPSPPAAEAASTGVDLETIAEMMAGSPLPVMEPISKNVIEPVPSAVAAAPTVLAAPLPGILPRSAAAMADLVVIQALWVVIVIAVNAVQRALPDLPQLPNAVPILLGALSGLVYVVSMTHRSGQTFGKSLLHLKVVDRGGAPPGLFRSAFRTVAMPLSAATFGLGYLWMAFDRRSQSLHDKVSSTYVIGRRLDPGAGLILAALLAALNWGLFDFLRVQLFA